MPNIPFPNVPKLPGVPALPRSPKFPPLAKAGLGLLQGALWRAFQVQTRWGIYDKNGVSVFDPSKITGIVGSLLESTGIGSALSTNRVDFKAESRVSNFPVEQGSFASYNKVEIPYQPQVTLCFMGTESERTKFLVTLENARKSTQLFNVVTPEVTFFDCTIESYDYARSSAGGVTLLKVNIGLGKIRQVTAQYSQANKGNVNSPKSSGATPQADNGKVLPQVPQVSTLKSIANKIPAVASKAADIIQGLVK